MPLPQKTVLTEYYEKIAGITGVDFKSGSLEDVNRALNQIYIDGTNVFSKLGINAMTSLDDGNVKAISNTLDAALSATNDTYSFVSVMNPDDPTAVPRMISGKGLKDDRGRDLNTTDRKKLSDARSLQQQKNTAAKNYESSFKKNHQQKLAAVNESLAKKAPDAPGDFRTGKNYFSRKMLNPVNGRIEGTPFLEGLKDDFMPAVDMANLILISRGYTMEELSGSGINAVEGRKEVGTELEELLTRPSLSDVKVLTGQSMSEDVRAARFKGLLEEAIDGLEKLRFKPVDLSDDTTLDNINYNRLIADMAGNMKKMVHFAQSDFKQDWFSEAAENVMAITNYTDGVMAMDTMRIQASQSKTRTEENVASGLTAQAYIDAIGPNYQKYRASDIGSAKNELSMAGAIDAASTGDLSEQQAAKEAQALRQAVRRNRPQEYKELVTEQIKDSVALQTAKKHADIVAGNKSVMGPKKEDAITWFTAEEGKTESDYVAAMGKVFPGNSQLDRISTIATMFMMYEAWDTEQRGEKFDLLAYLEDKDWQRRATEKASAFYQEHPINEDNMEEARKNTELFGKITASFYESIREVQVPGLDWDTPDEVEKMQIFTRAFKTILQDSEQLRDIVPQHNEELSQIFYNQNGGEEAYKKLKAQNGFAGMVLQAENDVLKAYNNLENKSLDFIYGNSDQTFNMRKLAVATYFLSNDGAQIMGRKLSEMPDVEALSAFEQGFFQNGVGNGDFRQLYATSDKAKTRENQRKLVDYVISKGENDELGVKEVFGAVAEALKPVYEEQYKDTTPKIPTMSEAIALADAEKRNPVSREEKKKQAEQRAREAEERRIREEEERARVAEALRKEEEAKKLAEELKKQQEAEEAARKLEEARKAEEAARRAAEEKIRQEQQAKEDAAKQAESRELSEIEKNQKHDWSSEVSEADWKARLELMDQKLAEKDPALLKSSAEYKAAREGLKEALKALNAPGGMNKAAFNESMDKVFQNAGDYIAKKENGKVGKYYGQDRLDAMRDLRGMLANRNSYVMKPTGIAELFGVGKTYQEKLESGFLRLGAYLNDAKIKELDHPEESRQMIDLVERVLAERGKNSVTRNKLREQMALQDANLFDEKAQAVDDANNLRQAKDAIMGVMRKKTSMTEKAADWFGVMNAYETMAEMSQHASVQKSGQSKAVREVAMCGRLAQKTMETRYKAMDFDAPEQLTRQEATEMVAFASLGEFMRHPDSTNHVRVFNAFMKSNDGEKQLLKNFADQNTVKKLCEAKGKEAINRISGRKAQQDLGILGMNELTKKMLQENADLQNAIVQTMNKKLAVSPEEMKAIKGKLENQQKQPQADQPKAKQANGIQTNRKVAPGIQDKINQLNKSAGRGLGGM